MTDDRHTDQWERDLRAMLSTRADDIRAVPERVLTFDGPRTDTDGTDGTDVGEVLELGAFRTELLATARRRWPVLVAAAVVLAALAGVLTVLATRPVHHQSATNHHPKLRTVVRTACRTAVPTSWKPVLAAATSDIAGLDGASVLAVTADGGAVVQGSGSVITGSIDRARLGYLAPSATRIHWLGSISYTNPPHQPYRHGSGSTFELDVDVSGHTALVTVAAGTHSVPGAVVAVPRKIVAVDLRSGAQTVLLAPSGSSRMKITAQAYALGSTAYVQLTPRTRVKGASLHDEIVQVPLGGGHPEVVARGSADIEKSALGVEWNLDDGPVDRPSEVPTAVSQHSAIDSLSGNNFDSYFTDGKVYAWQTLQGALDWYDPATNTLVQIPQLLGVPGISPGQAAIFAVAGPLVLFQNKYGTADRIVDTRTGAVLPASDTGQLFGARSRFVGDPSAFGIASVTSGGNLTRVSGGDLPAVHC